MVLCLGEPPGRFLFVVVYSVLLFILLLLFFISFPGYFTMSPALQPGFSGPWRPPPALSSIPITFDCLAFSCTANATVLSGDFFTHRRFLPYAPSPTFSSVYQGLPGIWQFFLEVCRYYTDPWNTDPTHLFVWFTVIHNLHIQENSFLKSTKYYHELLVVKSLVYMLLTSFELVSLVQSHI